MFTHETKNGVWALWLFRWYKHWQLDIALGRFRWFNVGIIWRNKPRLEAYYSPDGTPVHERARGLGIPRKSEL